MKSPSNFPRQSRISENSTCRSSLEETLPPRSPTVSFSPEDIHSSSTCTLNQPSPSTLHPSYHSQRSFIDDDNNKEQIWIKRRLSNSTIEKLFDRRKPFLWKEIIDVTV